MTIPLVIEGLTDTGFTFDQTLAEPGIYDLVVTTGGVEAARLDVAITVGDVIEPPVATIISITPNVWSEDITTAYTITGTGLLGVNNVNFVRTTDGFISQHWSGTSTDTTVPVNAQVIEAGVFDVRVFTPANTSTPLATLPAGLTITATPASLTSITPNTVPDHTVQTDHTIYGTDLKQAITARFVRQGGAEQVEVPVTGNYDSNAKTLDVLYPVDDSLYDLILLDTGGAEYLRLNSAVTVGTPVAPPTTSITSITPNTQVEDTSTTYTLTGTNLDTTVTVRLTDSSGLEWPSITPTSVSATTVVYEHATNTPDVYDVAVWDATQKLAELTDAVTITAATPPPVATITAITPNTHVELDAISYHVSGTGLGATDAFRYTDSAGNLVGTSFPTQNVTDTGFDVAGMQFYADVYDISAWSGGAEIAHLDDCLTITPAVP